MSTIDPRAYSEQKLEAPFPLPHISRNALKRCKDALPPPTECRYCRGPARLTDNGTIYGRRYGDWPFMWLCDHCEAYVGCHPHTDLPLGTLADAPLREARKIHKASFQAVLKASRKKRGAVYEWLAVRMGIPVSECHWGMFEAEQCEQAGAICKQALDTGTLP